MNNSNIIFLTINFTFQCNFENRKNIQSQFLQYFLNVTHKICSFKDFTKSIVRDKLLSFIDHLLCRLVEWDELSNKEPDSNSVTIIKLINSTMLRILENANPGDIYVSLIDLLTKYRIQATSNSRILGTIVKCILKLTKGLEQTLPLLNIEELLLKFHKYLCEITKLSTSV